MYFHKSLRDSFEGYETRLPHAIGDFLSAYGTVLHHSATSLIVVALATGQLPLTRYIISVALPLVVQHWVVSLKYAWKLGYVLVELALEVWWEFEVISNIPNFHEFIEQFVLWSMLMAHWMYFLGGTLSLVPRRRLPEANADAESSANVPATTQEIVEFNTAANEIGKVRVSLPSTRAAIDAASDGAKIAWRRISRRRSPNSSASSETSMEERGRQAP